MTLTSEYFDLTAKYIKSYGEKTILLMQVGAFYEVYGKCDDLTKAIEGSQIIDFSQICELNVVAKNSFIDKYRIHMAGFKDIMIEKYLRKLQEAGYTAVVYNQDATIKTERSCAGIFSPGTYFSNETTNLTNNISCIWIELLESNRFCKGKNIVVGISNIDIYTGKTSIYQFKETYINSPTTYDELERFISVFNPSEVIVISNLPEKEVNEVIQFVDITAKLIHKIQSSSTVEVKNCEKQTYQKEILHKFYDVIDMDIFMENFYDNTIATQSFCFLLDFVYQHNPNLVKNISDPVFENVSTRLHLANHSLKQLNVIDDNNYKGKYSSVLAMLNDCCTAMGKREFANLLTNPTTDIDYLQREYDITEYLTNQYDMYCPTFKTELSTIKDLSKFQRQVVINKITPKTFVQLYTNVHTIKDIFNKVRMDEQMYEYFLQTNQSSTMVLDCCDHLIDVIANNITVEVCKDIDQLSGFDINFIQPNVDVSLDTKCQLLHTSESKLESIRVYLNTLITDKSAKSSELVKIHETEKNNYALLCTSRRCKLLEGGLPYVQKTSTLQYDMDKTFQYTVCKNHFDYKTQSAANCSITDPVIEEMCKTITTAKVALKDMITNTFNKFVHSFQQNKNKLDIIVSFITTLDVIVNKASIARKYNYCKPVIEPAPKSFINVKDLRHCLIEHIQTNELYVSNDITLGDNAVDGMLLYGTNAVGKTSFIRAIGIATIMAQAGLFVPCSSFHYKPYNYIFTRILGNDNIFKGLSTFAVEMSELRTILKLADQNSLILGDELCSGTEIMSAISIFVSGMQQFYTQKSSFIFATHLHEIVDYPEITEMTTLTLAHMSVVYNKQQDMLVYDRKLKKGPGDNMYGLEVCKSLSLPEDFLARAYDIRTKYNSGYSNALSLKGSHFNSNKLMGMCEECGINKGTEVHHLQHQIEANNQGNISKTSLFFHKNALPNLLTLCETCHNITHKQHVKGSKKTKTTKGFIISPF